METPALEHLMRQVRTDFPDRGARIGPDDDLFDTLGIDSMQALSLLSAVEDHFDLEIPDYEMRLVRTLGQLADLVERRR